ncbi:MAG: SRPBCC domain-containing protein [Candidatus Acidiferrales bacterium]
MTVTAATLADNLTLTINQEMRVRAPLDTTFTALLEQMGPHNETPEGNPLPMKIEAWPGGRWYRDLGDNNGHFWGVVQAIKRPTLLEIHGPLFMSFAAVSDLQYRLSEANGVTVIAFRHIVLGVFPDELKEKMGVGWNWILDRTRKRAESPRVQ